MKKYLSKFLYKSAAKIKNLLDGNPYSYVFIRQDIPNVHKVVQCCHAVFESAVAGNNHGSIIILSVADLNEMYKVMEYLDSVSIRYRVFRESMRPYNGAITAICTHNLYGEQRKLLKDYKLLRFEDV